ncbi:hypothetical protein RYX36_000826 [Vicia faba]
MSKVVVLPITEIKQLKKDTFYVTVITIDKLIASQYRWYYEARYQCPKAGGITDPLEFPLALDKLLGKEKDFKVIWKSQWDSCSVISILEDDDVLKQLKENCGMDDEIEITSKLKSDPITLTAKGPNPDGSCESTTLANFADGELSSKKLNKQIKIEK